MILGRLVEVQRLMEPIEVDNAQFRIGKDTLNDLELTDGSISAEHAIIEFANGEAFIRDCGSRNGTFVNGIKVGCIRHRIFTGDQLRFGILRRLFEFEYIPLGGEKNSHHNSECRPNSKAAESRENFLENLPVCSVHLVNSAKQKKDTDAQTDEGIIGGICGRLTNCDVAGALDIAYRLRDSSVSSQICSALDDLYSAISKDVGPEASLGRLLCAYEDLGNALTGCGFDFSEAADAFERLRGQIESSHSDENVLNALNTTLNELQMESQILEEEMEDRKSEELLELVSSLELLSIAPINPASSVIAKVSAEERFQEHIL